MINCPLVSVIIPVYNVEKYLRQCVDSVIAQSYFYLDIVLVDDGSSDSSPAICDEYAECDARVRAFHKENGGLSDARNFGLKCARGAWISFIDSDDYVSPVFIEALLEAAVSCNCEISSIPFGKQFKDGEPCVLVDVLHPVAPNDSRSSRASCCFCPVVPAKPLASPCVQRLMLYQALDTGAPWRLYKREALGDNPFPKGLYYEDLASVYKIIRNVSEIAVFSGDIYAYRMRKDSIIRQEYRHIKAKSALQISGQLYRDICSWYPELADAAASRCFSVCRMVFAQVPTGAAKTEETENDRAELWDVLKRFRWTVLRDPSARKRERLAAFIACMGMAPFSAFCAFCRKTGRMQ